MESARATRANRRRNAIPERALQEGFLIRAEEDEPFMCVCCTATFISREEYGRHLLDQHNMTLCEPGVLRLDATITAPEVKSKVTEEASAGAASAEEEEEQNTCDLCNETFALSKMEEHMKKHKNAFMYPCNICNRRFKEPWFLKNHSRTHSNRSAAKRKLDVPETPTTINDVVQESVANSVASSYKWCPCCGHHFENKELQIEHCKNLAPGPKEETAPIEEASDPKSSFMGLLSLNPTGQQPAKTRPRWIQELNPVTSYQAWELSTKGKVALELSQVKKPFLVFNPKKGSNKKTAIWSAGKSPSVHSDETDSLKSDDSARASPAQEPKNQTSEEATQKDQEKMSSCPDCGKQFRSRRQMLHHAKGHRKERSDSESSSMTSVDGAVPSTSRPAHRNVEEPKRVKVEPESESEDMIDENVDDMEQSGATPPTSSRTTKDSASTQCPYCKKTFRSSYYLTIHIRTHTGEKPYRCEFCNFGAAQKTSMRYHLVKYHGFDPKEANAHVRSKSEGERPKKSPKKSPKKVKRKNRVKTERTAAIVKKEPEEEPMQASTNPNAEISLKCEETLEPDVCEMQDKSPKEIQAPAPPAVEPPIVPLDLTIKSRARQAAPSDDTAVVLTCPLCPLTTAWVDILFHHLRKDHKENYQVFFKEFCTKNPTFVLNSRRTSCPPALNGVDVPPPKKTPTTKTKTPKRVAAPSQKAIKSEPGVKCVEQENKQNNQQGGNYRPQQPNIQGTNHWVQRPQPNPPSWPSTPNLSNGAMNGPFVPLHVVQSLLAQRPIAITTYQGLGEAIANGARPAILASTTNNYANPEVMKILQPGQINGHNGERPPIAQSVLASNVPFPCGIDPRWSLARTMELPANGALIPADNPQSCSTAEVKQNPAYQKKQKMNIHPYEKRL